MFKKALLAGFAAATVSAAPASAALIVDASTIGAKILVGHTGNVTAFFDGSDAGFNNELYLEGPGGLIFRNHDAAYPVGASFDLGTFTAGTELVFRLHVVTTGDDFHSGSGFNPDGIAHAAANTVGNTTYVGFEDIYKGGDFDYNDLTFSLVNTPAGVPEPANWALLIAGFGMIGSAMRVRARQNISLKTA